MATVFGILLVVALLGVWLAFCWRHPFLGVFLTLFLGE